MSDEEQFDEEAPPTPRIESVPMLEVDRGQPVIMIATFADALTHGEPDRGVFFSFTHPGSDRPYVDDGYGQAKSKITHLALGVYRYTFSTKGFPAGVGQMVFTAEWEKPLPDGYDEVVVRGKYRVRESAESLI